MVGRLFFAGDEASETGRYLLFSGDAVAEATRM
jgi:hypothetical protein